MSLFGKMNQTEKAKTTAGSSGKQPWRSRWQKGSKALYHIGRLPVPTHRKISQVEHAAVAGRMSWLLLTYSCTAGWCGTELRVCRRRIVRVEATVIPGAVRF